MRFVNALLLMVVGLALVSQRPAPAAAQAGVADILRSLRAEALAVDAQYRALVQLLGDDQATPESVRQWSSQKSLDLLGNVAGTADVYRQIDAIGGDADLFRRVNDVAILTDSYTFAVVDLLNAIQQQAVDGASVADLRASAASSEGVASARSDLVAAFNALADQYGVDPLPAAP